MPELSPNRANYKSDTSVPISKPAWPSPECTIIRHGETPPWRLPEDNTHLAFVKASALLRETMRNTKPMNLFDLALVRPSFAVAANGTTSSLMHGDLSKNWRISALIGACSTWVSTQYASLFGPRNAVGNTAPPVGLPLARRCPTSSLIPNNWTDPHRRRRPQLVFAISVADSIVAVRFIRTPTAEANVEW
ncbi:hypothetical protein K458DRAFT_434584 [Lentithecium fluviatile CBS 122367]|uniref:Uncharacterized protein n=1 Tax=Lentithecium fluviatile CBS 122367 TaxID=1168545 RepID=A0A6G1IQF3_9PLEO|nr:hypothetical protein K458DRAFT_434584 [Lentithecium fluviatile CBS 122367]